MSIAGGLLAVVAIAAFLWLTPLLQGKYQRSSRFACATLLAVSIVGAGTSFVLESHSREPSEFLTTAMRVGSVAWRDESPLVPVSRREPTRSSTVTGAAPVHSLVGGLEARLERNPDDANGWALLAQSYAFLGDWQAAEQALGRAVELGMDEAALRERVRLARRDVTPPRNWIEEAIGG